MTKLEIQQKMKELEAQLEIAEQSEQMHHQQEQQHPFIIGKDYFIRTVTYHMTGRLVGTIGSFLVLEKAAVIFDSGRFSEFMAGNNPSSMEVEPYGDRLVYINISTIVDATEHKLCLEVK